MKKLLAVLGCSLCALNVNASSLQIFAENNFYNPAELAFVKKGRLEGGFIFTEYKWPFVGTTAIATTDTTVTGTGQLFMPIGQFAYRLSDKVVFGATISEPYASDINFAETSIMRNVVSRVHVYSTDLAPQLSYLVNPTLAVGIGLNIQYMELVMNANPVAGKTGSTADNIAFGANAGLIYRPNKRNLITFSYHSKISQHLSGTSESGPTKVNTYRAVVKLPDTFGFKFLHVFNSRVRTTFQAYYSRWNDFSQLLRYNVVGSTDAAASIPLNYRNTWYLMFSSKLNATENFYITPFVSYDQDPENNVDRVVQWLSAPMVAVGASVGYQLLRSTNVEFTYAHQLYNRVRFNQPGVSVGSMRPKGNYFALKATANFA